MGMMRVEMIMMGKMGGERAVMRKMKGREDHVENNER